MLYFKELISFSLMSGFLILLLNKLLKDFEHFLFKVTFSLKLDF